MVSPRRRVASAAKTLSDELPEVVRQAAPATVVLEVNRKHVTETVRAEVRTTLRDVTSPARIEVVEVQALDACAAIGGSRKLDAPVSFLAECYPEIAARLEPAPTFFRSRHHRREVRPLIAAAALAHAVALQAIRAVAPEDFQRR